MVSGGLLVNMSSFARATAQVSSSCATYKRKILQPKLKMFDLMWFRRYIPVEFWWDSAYAVSCGTMLLDWRSLTV